MKKFAPLILVALLLAMLAGAPRLRRATKAAAAAADATAHENVAAASAPSPAGDGTGSPADGTSSLNAATSTTSTLGSAAAPRTSAPDPSVAPTSPPHAQGSAPVPPPDDLAARLASAATPADLLQAADLADPVQRAYVVARLAEMEEQQRETALATAERLGIPVRIEGPGNKVSILYDFRDGRPLYRTTLNANAAISTGANILRDQPAPYGLTGSGLRVGVWDAAKVRTTHQEFSGGRAVIKDSASTFSDHATHVAGTIGAAGVVAAAKGMAPQVGIDSYDWNNDNSEMTAAGAASGTDTTRLSLSNHSYGYDSVASDMGRYETEARTMDALAAALPFYQIFWAAGNDRDVLTTLGGYQSITYTGLAKNVITVGAADDAVSGGLRAPSAGVLAYFSSMGPCDDGRVKPDLTANGVNLYSPISTANASYNGTYSGTSMATPNAVGSALLVQQLYAREFSGQRLRASMLKALLIQTADDIGRPGPDYQYGWGYLNVRAAADLVLAHKASLGSPKLIEGTLTNVTRTQTHVFSWDGVSPIRATLCWTDPAGSAQTATDSRAANLVHDLDLRLVAPDGVTTTLPYVMPFVGTWTLSSMSQNAVTGANHVDNVEQVRVAAPSQPGNYTLTVSFTGSLTSSQPYSLVVAGGANVETNPAPVVALDSPADGAVFLSGAPVPLTATATDQAIGGASGVVAGVEFFADSTSLGIVFGAPYAKTWRPSTTGAYTLTALAADTEGAATRSAARRITVLSGDGTPALTGLAPSSGDVGDVVTLTGANFAAVSSVRFNGVSALFTVDSPTSIHATVPVAATTGPVTVATSLGVATSATSFTVVRHPVLISQIYGGGGGSGATYNADYVELLNRGDTTVNVAGWSVQYASASGTTWQAATLSGSIPPGTYYLVKLSYGSTGAALPAPDATGTLNLSATLGKVALRSSGTLFTGSSPVAQTGLQDFVGYGAANAYEGTPAPSPSATTALIRAGGGVSDTGDNSADFSAAAPNPRNTLVGPPAAPVVTSATNANSEAGKAFSYQITASNMPTSFAASGLPPGLTVNTYTGLVSGVPTSIGTYATTIAATNATGTGEAALTLVITTAVTTIFSENMGAPSAATAITANVFQNAGLAFTGTAEARPTPASSGYTGASGGGNIFFTNSVGSNFEISGIDTRGYANLVLRFAHHKSTTASGNELAVSVSGDGQSYATLTYTRTGSANIWSLVTPNGAIPATANLRIRFSQTTTAAQFRLDDVMLTGSPAIPTFAEWADGLADPAPAADPDADGASNLLEYFMALDPESADAILPQATAGGGMLRLDYRRNKTLNNVVGAVEWSASLAGTPLWSTSGVFDVLLSEEGAYELRRASVPFSAGETAKFLRLRVTLPQP